MTYFTEIYYFSMSVILYPGITGIPIAIIYFYIIMRNQIIKAMLSLSQNIKEFMYIR